MKHWKKLMAFLLALCMLLSLAACGGGTNADTDTKQTDTATDSGTQKSDQTDSGASTGSDVGTAADTEKSYVDTLYIGEYNCAAFVKNTFDPTGLTGSISDNGNNYMIYDMLFYVNADGEYNSRVVDDWSWTDDTHMVITLKDNIYFSNGDQLMADDVLYSLEKRASSSMRSSYYQIFLTDESTISDDGLTLTLVTASANSVYMSGLDFAILDKDYIESIGWDNIDWSDPDQIVGSGPYAVSYYVMDSEIRYEKRDDYWGLAYGYDDTVLEYIVYNYTDRSTLSIDFETGVIDLAIDLNETDYANLLDSSDDITAALIHSNVIITINWDVVNNEYLADPTIREALCYALDPEAMTTALNNSYGGLATSTLAEGEIGYVSGYTYGHDVAKAKQLLSDAGISDGEITLTILCWGTYETLATVMQSNLAEVGVTLDVQSVDVASYWGNIGGAGNSDIMIYGISTLNPSCDPATHISYYKSTSNFSVMRRDYDDLIVGAETTLDEAERISLYQQLQQRWYENFDCVPVCEYLTSFAYSNDVIESLELASSTSPWLFDAVYVTD